MRSLLLEDNLTVTMGENARKRYEKLFSGEALGNAYTSVYNELLAS